MQFQHYHCLTEVNMNKLSRHQDFTR